MLLATEWASRVGLNQSLIDEDPLKPQAIGALVIWRALALSPRNMWSIRINAKAARTYPFSNDGDFWRQLAAKKFSMFGAGTSTSIDPIVAYRHPWCLTNTEFAEAKAKIDNGEAPTNLSDDRIRVSTICAWIAPISGVASPAGMVAKMVAPPLAAAGTVFAAVSGVDALTEKIGDIMETAAFKAALPGLKEVYAREARYREIELQQPLAA